MVVAVVTLALFGGSLPLPGSGGPGPGGPIRTATPSNIVVIPDDPRAEVPGTLLYVKDGNIWEQSGDTARQLTSSGVVGEEHQDAMPAWSPDGASIYFVRTVRESGRWPSGGITRTYNLQVPTLFRMAADGSGEPERPHHGAAPPQRQHLVLLHPRARGLPDGTEIAIVTDGPDPHHERCGRQAPRPRIARAPEPAPGADPGAGAPGSGVVARRPVPAVRPERARGRPRGPGDLPLQPGERAARSRSPAAATRIRRGRATAASLPRPGRATSARTS